MLQKIHSKRGGFTLVEIMIVVAIIALLASIAVPNFLRSRKRAQATQILQDLRQIDGAKDQFAIEYNKKSTDALTWANVQIYLKTGTRLYTSGGKDLFGNAYGITTVDAAPTVNSLTKTELAAVAPGDFWSPYN